MRSPALAALTVLALALLGCSGGDGDNSSADAAPTIDAAPQADAPPTATAHGEACTVNAASPQSTCPTGYVCIGTADAAPGFCSTQCAAFGEACDDFVGPGAAGCFIYSGGTAEAPEEPYFCRIFCQGPAEIGCTAETCDGTCPNDLTCTDISGGQGVSACEV